jgi:hypothetical protein
VAEGVTAPLPTAPPQAPNESAAMIKTRMLEL